MSKEEIWQCTRNQSKQNPETTQGVLPGGGDLCLRVWSGVRRFVFDLVGWHEKGSTNRSAYSFRMRMMDLFLDRKGHHNAHAWKMLDQQTSLRLHCELLSSSTTWRTGSSSTRKVTWICLKISSGKRCREDSIS